MMRLSPREFWGMSLKEWAAAVSGFAERYGANPHMTPLSRKELEALMHQYPD